MSCASDLAGHLFQAQEPDDQYSPDIIINRLAPAELKAVFDLFRSRSDGLGPDDYVWSKNEARAIPLADLTDPTTMVVTGEGEQFHVLFYGIRTSLTRLPVLGAFVSCRQDVAAIALHYYINERWNGPDRWTADAVDGLFDLLRDVQCLAAQAAISYDPNLPPAQRHAFDAALRCNSPRADSPSDRP